MITQRGSQIRETLAASGYKVARRIDQTEVVLRPVDGGYDEVWMMNDHYAGYVIEIDGKGYEFISQWSGRV